LEIGKTFKPGLFNGVDEKADLSLRLKGVTSLNCLGKSTLEFLVRGGSGSSVVVNLEGDKSLEGRDNFVQADGVVGSGKVAPDLVGKIIIDDFKSNVGRYETDEGTFGHVVGLVPLTQFRLMFSCSGSRDFLVLVIIKFGTREGVVNE
jgi:hypothetical protein